MGKDIHSPGSPQKEISLRTLGLVTSINSLNFSGQLMNSMIVSNYSVKKKLVYAVSDVYEVPDDVPADSPAADKAPPAPLPARDPRTPEREAPLKTGFRSLAKPATPSTQQSETERDQPDSKTSRAITTVRCT